MYLRSMAGGVILDQNDEFVRMLFLQLSEEYVRRITIKSLNTREVEAVSSEGRQG